jgi:hypothetical protein
MDYLETFVGIMVACHGADAEKQARKLSKRCKRRLQLDWAEKWWDVAERIADGGGEVGDGRRHRSTASAS